MLEAIRRHWSKADRAEELRAFAAERRADRAAAAAERAADRAAEAIAEHQRFARAELLVAASAYLRASTAMIQLLAQLDDLLYQERSYEAHLQIKDLLLTVEGTRSALMLLVDGPIRDRLLRFDEVCLMYIEGFSEGRVRSNDRAADEQFRKLGRLNGDITDLSARALGATDRSNITAPGP